MDYPRRFSACQLWKTYSTSTNGYIDSNLGDFFNPDMELFTFTISFETVGCCLVSKDNQLRHLVVHPDHRRSKIATNLIMQVVSSREGKIKAESIYFGEGETSASYEFFSNCPHFKLYGVDTCERVDGPDYKKYIFTT